MGIPKNRLVEAVLLSIHNIFFFLEIKMLILNMHSYPEACMIVLYFEYPFRMFWFGNKIIIF